MKRYIGCDFNIDDDITILKDTIVELLDVELSDDHVSNIAVKCNIMLDDIITMWIDSSLIGDRVE